MYNIILCTGAKRIYSGNERARTRCSHCDNNYKFYKWKIGIEHMSSNNNDVCIGVEGKGCGCSCSNDDDVYHSNTGWIIRQKQLTTVML